MSNFNKAELAALAMHELMSREQQKYRDRIDEQRKISLMTDEHLREIVNDATLTNKDKDNKAQLAQPSKGDK